VEEKIWYAFAFLFLNQKGDKQHAQLIQSHFKQINNSIPLDKYELDQSHMDCLYDPPDEGSESEEEGESRELLFPPYEKPFKVTTTGHVILLWWKTAMRKTYIEVQSTNNVRLIFR
jgi:hypothetical protein